MIRPWRQPVFALVDRLLSATSASFLVALMTGLSSLGSVPEPSPTGERDWKNEREFWSFHAPTAQPQPVVRNRRWPQQPLDYFILARLESQRLSPSLEAGKRTLIRRVTFDLTGLPPAPEEVAVFLADRRADAYERYVEHLLESPRFGEHMASLWLPLARYAEDQAHQVGEDTKYFYPNAWRYRQWIIEAFNRDLPYNEFIKLQLAADKFEGPNSTNLAALGFLGLGPKYYDRDRLAVQADEWEDRVDTVSRAMLGLTVACARCHDHKFDPISMQDYYALAGVFASTRMVNRKPDGTAEKSDAQITNMAPATLHVVEDSDKIEDLPVFLRGNVEHKGPMAERRFLRLLSPADSAPFKEGSGRKELALAIADESNPLTARVMINRVWAQFFPPLVPTPSNFGHSGQPPTYPELLDDLTVRFLAHGWSIKSLVREIVLSATYRQESHGRTVDPENELLGRMNRRRLTIEQWRDAVLSATGELEAGNGKSLELDDPTNRCRTVYARVSRLKLNDVLLQFDYPDANVHAEKRSVTTTAIQKLFMLNSPFMLQRAKSLAPRLTAKANDSDETRIRKAYQLLFAREVSREELRLALAFLNKPAHGEMPRWEQYAQLLLVSDEMLYVD